MLEPDDGMDNQPDITQEAPRRRRVLTALAIAFGGIAVTLWASSMALEPAAVGTARAPDPARYPDAVVQVYGADVWGWRGRFAIHTWIATKGRDAETYDIYQVIGWRERSGRPVLSRTTGNPARHWYGSPPVLLHEVRGNAAETLVPKIRNAVDRYPFDREYTMWPGPNSNSFTAWVGLEVPELGLDLPAKAIGQSWMKRQYPALRQSGQ